jgi:hypothetical protein
MGPPPGPVELLVEAPPVPPALVVLVVLVVLPAPLPSSSLVSPLQAAKATARLVITVKLKFRKAAMTVSVTARSQPREKAEGEKETK